MHGVFGKAFFGKKKNLRIKRLLKRFFQFVQKQRAVPIFLIALILCGGCASSGKKAASSNDSGLNTKHSESYLAEALLRNNSALSVEDVFACGKTLLIKFSLTTRESDAVRYFYALSLLDFHAVNGNGAPRSFRVPLEFVSEEEWRKKCEDKEPVQFLESYQWPQLKELLARDLLDQQPNRGISVPFEQEDFVLYYDESAQLSFVPKAQVPQGVEIFKEISPEEVQVQFFSSLKTLMQSEAPNSGVFSRILLSVDSSQEDANPFVYVDLDERIIASLYFSIPSQSPRKKSLVKNGIKTADYLILDSNVFGIVSHPFSSVLRLFYWSKNTALDIVTPQKVVLLDPRPVPPLKENRSNMDLQAFEESLDSLVGKNSASGKMRFLIGGDAFFPRLITALLEAKHSIYFRIFIFDNDDYAVKIADILKAKSKEKGVEVYVLLDRMGQVMGEGKMPDDLPQGFEPPDSLIDYLQKDSHVHVRVTPSSFFKADHIKTIIVDEQIAFTGGMNIGREYRYAWHDLMLELRGPIIRDILKDFDLAWANAGPLGDFEYVVKRKFYRHKKTSSEGFYPIRPLFTRLNHPQIFQAQIQAIKKAQNYIYINNAYFSDDTILRELILARRRGVDVRVILPIASNHEIMNANNVITSNLLFKNGIKVYFYPGMSHVKAAIYDGWLCAGSANFDRLSFRDNKELNLSTTHPSTVNYLKKELFEKDFQKSQLMQAPLDSSWRNFIAEFLAEQL